MGSLSTLKIWHSDENLSFLTDVETCYIYIYIYYKRQSYRNQNDVAACMQGCPAFWSVWAAVLEHSSCSVNTALNRIHQKQLFAQQEAWVEDTHPWTHSSLCVFWTVRDSSDGKCPRDDKTENMAWEIPGLLRASYCSLLMRPWGCLHSDDKVCPSLYSL